MRLLLTFLAGATFAAAQKVYLPNELGIVPPHLIQSAGAEYTEQARAARLEGSVTVSLIVDADASLRDIYVSRSLGLGLDEKAVEAVRQWQFSPGTHDGAPAAVLIKVEVNFRMLIGRGDWHLTRAQFDSPKGATPPRVIEPEFPPAIARDAYASGVVSFDIDERGAAVNLHVESVSNDRYEHDLIAAVRSWKFEPARKEGRPVTVRATFGFSAGQAPGS